MNEKNKILYAIDSQICFIKLIGRIIYSASAGFDAMIRAELKKGEVDQYIFDLREAEYIDSTNLGIIASVLRYKTNKSSKKPIIISTNNDINAILFSMNFEKIFEIVNDFTSPPDKYIDTADFIKDSREPNEFILDSHKTLLNVNDATKRMFAGIVKEFEERNKRHSTNK